MEIWMKDNLNIEMIWKIWKKSKSNNEKIGARRKRIVKWYGNYGRKASQIFKKKYEKYGRKIS